jgi:hypothetical protein
MTVVNIWLIVTPQSRKIDANQGDSSSDASGSDMEVSNVELSRSIHG